jgi:hypothetical protein
MLSRTFIISAFVLMALFAHMREALAAMEIIDCTPVEVASLERRIHVRCSTGRNGIVYFSLGTNRTASETAFANRALQIANMALVSGRPLVIRYESTDTSGTAIGCLDTDCRLIQTIYLH